jgi:hypothetical protein
VFELFRTQGEATLAYWQSMMTARSPSEAVQMQTAAVRQACEATTDHWSSIASKTTRFVGELSAPFGAWRIGPK